MSESKQTDTNGGLSASVRVGIYARVSSDQQAEQQTIQSQVSALRERVEADCHSLAEQLCFLDDGVSGATLTRPALEKLRDTAYAGGIQKLYVHSPDRLARKYAWQVLLLDELQSCGVEVVFLNHTMGASPEEDLLLQMQGMFAEYERAKILERSRRGKRHAAQRGVVKVTQKRRGERAPPSIRRRKTGCWFQSRQSLTSLSLKPFRNNSTPIGSRRPNENEVPATSCRDC